MKTFIFLTLLLTSLTTQAQRQHRPTLTYDLGASTGTYNDISYAEVQLGLNWFVQDYLNWRNAVFTRFGSDIDSASGLDTSARLTYNTEPNDSGLGIGLFGGPGYRISNKENSGVFGEAGLTLKAGGLAIGGGVKAIRYNSPGQDSSGRDLPRADTVIFIILAGGGAF